MPAETLAPAIEPFGRTPARFLQGLGVASRLVIGNTSSLKKETLGLEHLQNIPRDSRIILAVSHLTDTDLAITGYTLGRLFDIALTNQSTQHTFDPGGILYLGSKAVGQGNFFPIDYEQREEADGVKRIAPARFNPDNFLHMVDRGLARGKTIAVAAHNPEYGEEGTLPSQGGLAVPFLAELGQAIIIPVAVSIGKVSGKSRAGMATTMAKDIAYNVLHPMRRPHAHVAVGKPIFPSGSVADAKAFGQLMTKRRNGEVFTEAEQVEMMRLRETMSVISGKVMESLSVQLQNIKERFGEA